MQSAHDSSPWSDLSVEERYLSSVGGSSRPEGSRRKDRGLEPFRRYLIASDLVCIFTAIGIGLLVSSRASTWAIDPVLAVYSVPPVIGLIWIGFLFARGAYDERIIGLGTEEVRRVISASLLTFGVVAGVSYLFRADISRAYAFISLPLGIILIVAARFFWRGWLYRARARGRFMVRTMIVGSGQGADELAAWLEENTYAGFQVSARFGRLPDNPLRLDAWLNSMDEVIQAKRIEAVALAPLPSMPSSVVNQVGWRLEGRQIDLLIAPAILDVAGPRLSMRPVAGLPILHLDEAVLSRSQRVSKRSLDIVLTLLLIVLLSPMMIAVAIAVRASSKGPVIFRQPRVGRAGQTFTMLKFRTMVVNADDQRSDLRRAIDSQEPMFKMVDDPRVTRVGRFLRRWSLDELPQLFNVLGGSMSLVGPRPHPLDDVSRYEVEAYRRLALKPGLTGLWQVEGRSDLSWAQALQLDIYYVERWTLAGDIVLLARTVRAVIQGRGAV